MGKEYKFIEPLGGERNIGGVVAPNGTPRICALANATYTNVLTGLISGDYTGIFDKFKNLTNMILSIKSIPYDVYSTNSGQPASDNIFTGHTPLYIGERKILEDVPTLPLQFDGYNDVTAKFYFTRDNLDEILNESFIDYNSFSMYSWYLPFIG